MLGVEDIEVRERDKIQEEAKLYDDIIYFMDVKNSYFSLTDRTIRVFQFIIMEQQRKFSYVLKCDDDTFLDVRRIATELQNKENPGRFYWGYMVLTAVFTRGVWSEKNWNICETYNPYA